MAKNLSHESKLRKYKYDAEYNLEHTTQVKLKLNNRTDADILSYLSTKPNKQGFVKEVIRDRMTLDGFKYSPDSPEEADNEHD